MRFEEMQKGGRKQRELNKLRNRNKQFTEKELER